MTLPIWHERPNHLPPYAIWFLVFCKQWKLPLFLVQTLQLLQRDRIFNRWTPASLPLLVKQIHIILQVAGMKMDTFKPAVPPRDYQGRWNCRHFPIFLHRLTEPCFAGRADSECVFYGIDKLIYFFKCFSPIITHQVEKMCHACCMHCIQKKCFETTFLGFVHICSQKAVILTERNSVFLNWLPKPCHPQLKLQRLRKIMESMTNS